MGYEEGKISNKKSYPKKFSNAGFLVLEDSISFNALVSVKTTEKKGSIENIRNYVYKNQLTSEKAKVLRNEKIDLAIVYYTNKRKVSYQDVDNVAKVVLDALKSDDKNDFPGLFKDDSQVTRLLIYKKLKRKIEDYDTFEVVISARVHDASKEMILKQKLDI